LRVVRRDIKGEANNEADVKRMFKFDMKGKFAVLQTPMEMSKAIYAKVREKVSLEVGYEKLIRSAGEARCRQFEHRPCEAGARGAKKA
jgi:hypothetical protein